jgi:hypothetical protein
MKIKETTEEASSHPAENGLGSPETHGATSRDEEKSRADWEKGLANPWRRNKVNKKSTPVVGKNPNGKSQWK